MGGLFLRVSIKCVMRFYVTNNAGIFFSHICKTKFLHKKLNHYCGISVKNYYYLSHSFKTFFSFFYIQLVIFEQIVYCTNSNYSSISLS